MFDIRWRCWIATACFLVFASVDANENTKTGIQVNEVDGVPTAIRQVAASRAKHWADVTSLSYHPSGELLVSGGDDQAIRIWKSDTLTLLDQIEFLPGLVHKVEFLGDGRIVVILHDSNDEKLYMTSWSIVLILVPSGDELGNSHWREQSRITGFVKQIQSVAATPDATRLFLDDGSHAIHVYNLESDKPIWIDTVLFPGSIQHGFRGFPRRRGFPFPFTPSENSPLLTHISGQPSFRDGDRPLALSVTNDGATLIALTDRRLRTYQISQLQEPVSEIDVSGQVLAVAQGSKSVVVGDTAGKLSVFKLSEDGSLSDRPVTKTIDSRGLSEVAISGDGSLFAASSVASANCLVAAFANGMFGRGWKSLDLGPGGKPLGMADQPIYWHYQLHNETQGQLPLAFHPNGTTIATVRSRRQIATTSVDGSYQLSLPQQELPGDSIGIWDAPNRNVYWLDDSETLLVATDLGGAMVNTRTGSVSGITESDCPALSSVDGSIVWGVKRNDDGRVNPFFTDTKSGKVKNLDLGWLGIQQRLPVTMSPDGKYLAQLNSDQLQLDLLDLSTGKQSSVPFPNKLSRLIQFDTSNRLWAMYLSRSKTNGSQHNLVRVDLNAGFAAKVDTLYQEIASGASFDDAAMWVKKPELDRFTVSRNGETVVYCERTGNYRVLTDPSSRRSRCSVDAIRCISNDGRFFVTLSNVNLGFSYVSIVLSQTGETIQYWRLPGVLTDLDLSVDERSIATANANGSLSILGLKDKSAWPAVKSAEEMEAQSNEELLAAENSLKKLNDEFQIIGDAFEARLSGATSKDEQTQIECDEPYSSHILDLIQLAKQYEDTDVEYKALHRAIAMKRVTPPHVPGAPWSHKRGEWYEVSSEADRQLTVIARLEFANRFIDDPRTASVLRPVIEYWVTKETKRVLQHSWELSLRSEDDSVIAAALLIFSEVNMGEQRKFLSSGHRVTEPTEDQLRKSRSTLQQVIRQYGEIDIPGVGNVGEKAKTLILELDQAGQ
ncbi:WD domain, G-beta repeat [Planctomycetes bacterium CA13]|uniref:WD domain, G-beta repeat n=1 Tax=Novipirellula herctigrandis TaxID=2527986 RepID=A0A5C5ZBQ1_9BACT|nr:WD domain, G-beta repeat [Planctomycetes bacterium CA13]